MSEPNHPDGRVRIIFRLDPGEQQSYETETLWAEPFGPNEFRILNSPFFVFGVSAEDVVTAALRDHDVYEFKRVVEKGGHSTYRIFLRGDRTIADDCFRLRWTGIQSLGATFENGNGTFIAVDVPPSANIRTIYQLLEQGENAGIWAFEEANFEAAAGRVP